VPTSSAIHKTVKKFKTAASVLNKEIKQRCHILTHTHIRAILKQYKRRNNQDFGRRDATCESTWVFILQRPFSSKW
jgi:hypothetical protein